MEMCNKLACLVFVIFLMPVNLFANEYFDVIDAINKGDLNRIKVLFSNGIDVNKKVGGMSPLIYAAIRGQKEIAEFLISRGAKINVTDDIEGFIGGRTTLMHAVLAGHIEIVDFLISKGADIITTAIKYMKQGPILC